MYTDRLFYFSNLNTDCPLSFAHDWRWNSVTCWNASISMPDPRNWGPRNVIVVHFGYSVTSVTVLTINGETTKSLKLTVSLPVGGREGVKQEIIIFWERDKPISTTLNAISGIRHEVDENCADLVYYAASNGKFLPTFRDNKNSWPLKMGPIGYTGTLVRNYHYSLRNNPEERSSHLPTWNSSGGGWGVGGSSNQEILPPVWKF